MISQPFPNLNARLTTPDGMLAPVWRAFFQSIWSRGGGSIATAFALINGSSTEPFSAAVATSPSDVVTLAQAQASFQPVGSYANLAGDSGQIFSVAVAGAGANAVPLSQMTGAISSAVSAAVAPLAPKASPSFTGWVKLPSYTVAGLPAAAAAGAGAIAYITDGLAPTFGAVPVGGGAVGVPVNSDGAAWHVG